MDRIVVGTVGTIAVGFEIDEVDTDAAGTVTVAGVSLDGTTLFSANAADAAGTGNYSYLVEAVDTTQPDIVKVTWTGTFSGAVQVQRTDLAIVGDNYFSIAQLRAWEPAVSSASSYTLAALRQARAWAETRAEQIMCRSFVRSVASKTFAGSGRDQPLGWRDVRSIRSVTVDGVAQSLTSYELVNRAVYPVLRGSWPTDTTCVVIFEHGATWVPDTVARAVASLAAHRAAMSNTGIPSRADRWQPDGAGGLFSLAMASGTKVGLPEVDAVFESFALPGFA